jgi:hypothetical protein
MNAIRPFAVGLAVLAVALAGCTGGFNVNQTEPIRVKIEGEPQTVVVHETDNSPQKVVLKACDNACQDVQVHVQVKKLVDGPCRLHVIIQDEDGNTLEERDVDVDQEAGSSGSASTGMTSSTTTTGTGNATGNETSSTETSSAASTATGGSSGTTIVQNFVVNIKGKQNVVVLTQAIQGSAEVQVNTANANGNASVTQGNTSGNATMTTSGNVTSDTSSTTGY